MCHLKYLNTRYTAVYTETIPCLDWIVKRVSVYGLYRSVYDR